MGERTCSVETCVDPVKGRGWCRRHYLQWYRTGDPIAPAKPTECAVDGCGGPVHCRGWCEPHYKRWWYAGDPVKTATAVSCELCDQRFVRPPDGRTVRCDPCRAAATAASDRASTRAYRQRNGDDIQGRRQARSRPCLVCDGVVQQGASPGPLLQLCGDECRSVHFTFWRQNYNDLPHIRDLNQARHHQRRAWKWAVEWESFKPREIFDRDDWTCSICTLAIDAGLRYPDRWSASLDHVIPLSKGGSHTRRNTAAAHLTCNIKKGVRLVVAA